VLAASTSLRVHVSVAGKHVHPVPPIVLAVNPEGNVSINVTAPFVGPVPMLLTVIV
jgi:hypothetical protein